MRLPKRRKQQPSLTRCSMSKRSGLRVRRMPQWRSPRTRAEGRVAEAAAPLALSRGTLSHRGSLTPHTPCPSGTASEDGSSTTGVGLSPRSGGEEPDRPNGVQPHHLRSCDALGLDHSWYERPQRTKAVGSVKPLERGKRAVKLPIPSCSAGVM
jgi:hypothetical protein